MTTSTKNNKPSTGRDTLSDRRDRLARIVDLYGRALDYPGAETSQHFAKSCALEATAAYLIKIIDSEGLEAHIDRFIESATLDLWQTVRLLPYPDE